MGGFGGMVSIIISVLLDTILDLVPNLLIERTRIALAIYVPSGTIKEVLIVISDVFVVIPDIFPAESIAYTFIEPIDSYSNQFIFISFKKVYFFN